MFGALCRLGLLLRGATPTRCRYRRCQCRWWQL